MEKKNFTKYFLKNSQGSLVPRTEVELIDLIQSKTVKGETKVFSTQFSKWVKLKELNIYKNKNQYNQNEKIDELQTSPVSEKPDTIEHAEYIHLLDQLEDAKAIAFKAKFESSDRIQKLEVENEKLKEKIKFLEYSNKEVKTDKDYYLKEYEKLQKELQVINKNLKFDKHDTELTKAKAQIKSLTTELNFMQAEYDSQTEFNNKLILQNEELKSDIITYHELKEKFETENNKLNNERKFYVDKLATYKDEIERLALEVQKKRELNRKIAEKLESESETYSQHKYSFNELKSENEQLKKQAQSSLAQLEKVQKMHHEMSDDYVKFKTKSFEQEIELKKLKAENDYIHGNLAFLNKQKAELEEKVSDLSYMPPVPDNHITLSEHENLVDLKEVRIKGLEEEVEKLNEEKTSLLEQKENELKKKNNEIEYIKSRAQKLLLKKKQLEELARKQKIAIKKVTEAKNLVLKKYGDKVQEFDSQIETYKNDLEEQRNKNKEMLTGLNNITTNEVEVDTLLNHQKDIADDAIVADEESIGELFEVSNDPLWTVRSNGDVHGPHTFLEIKQMLQDRDVDENTTVKKPGAPWKKISEIFEFNTEVLTKKEDDDDDVKLYIKREDMRVPLFEDVTMWVGSQEFQGKCTNLSSGGCFVESSAFNNKVFKVGKDIKVEFTGDGPHKGLVITSQLRSITADVTPGAGFQFKDMDHSKLKVLNHFFMKFSKTFGQKAA